jgi:hypothetical protein
MVVEVEVELPVAHENEISRFSNTTLASEVSFFGSAIASRGIMAHSNSDMLSKVPFDISVFTCEPTTHGSCFEYRDSGGIPCHCLRAHSPGPPCSLEAVLLQR